MKCGFKKVEIEIDHRRKVVLMLDEFRQLQLEYTVEKNGYDVKKLFGIPGKIHKNDLITYFLKTTTGVYELLVGNQILLIADDFKTYVVLDPDSAVEGWTNDTYLISKKMCYI